jgi:RNA polymerase-binding protein DksA
MSDTLNMEMIQQILEEEKEKLQKQLQTFSGNDPTADKNLDQMDIAQVYSDQGLSHALQMSERRQLAQVEAALQSIAAGSYGRCQHCRQPISLERLQVMPNATMCVNC